MKNQELSLFHSFAFLFKCCVLVRCVIDIVQSALAASSLYRTVDLVFYVLMLVPIAFSIWKHSSKKGFIALVVYLAVSFVFNVVVFVVMKDQITDLSMSVMNWALGIALQYFLVFLYFKRDWRQLNA